MIGRGLRHLAKANVMTIEYELAKEDLTAFNFYHHFQSPTARRQYYRSWFTPVVVWMAVCTGVS